MNARTMGVVVARFQSPGLHFGHRWMLTRVMRKHDVLLVVLGKARSYLPTVANPLGVIVRHGLVLEWEQALGGDGRVIVTHTPDCRSDILWSKRLDELVRREMDNDGATRAVLYGSRDSFLKRYHGDLPREELPALPHVSGSALRDRVIANSIHPDFWTTARAEGAIAQVGAYGPTVYQTVDVAIIDRDRRRVLFALKEEDQLPDQEKLRFVGGFVDRDDVSLEDAAKREVMEETGLEVGAPVYVGSFRVDDWRYREPDGSRIFTALFLAPYVSGAAKAADDISKVRWVSFEELQLEPRPWLVDEHHGLLAAALDAIIHKKREAHKRPAK